MLPDRASVLARPLTDMQRQSRRRSRSQTPGNHISSIPSTLSLHYHLHPLPLHCAGVVRTAGTVLSTNANHDTPLNESIMEVATPSAINGNGPSPAIEAANPDLVLEHIVSLIEISLGAARSDLKAVGSLLSDTKYAESLERVAQFAADSEVAIYAQKDRRDELVNGHDDTPSEFHGWSAIRR